MNSRRDFLQKITGGLILLNIPSTSSANPEQINESPSVGPVLRVAIMGLGGYGTRVAEAMQTCKMAKLTGIISGTPSKIKDWKTKYHIPEGNCYNLGQGSRTRTEKQLILKQLGMPIPINPRKKRHGGCFNAAVPL